MYNTAKSDPFRKALHVLSSDIEKDKGAWEGMQT